MQRKYAEVRIVQLKVVKEEASEFTRLRDEERVGACVWWG